MDKEEIRLYDNIKEAINLLDQNEEYYNELINLQSVLDRKTDFWMHYIEFNKCDTTKIYRIHKELKKIREERRECKNNLEIMRVFHTNEGKMQNNSNRKMLLIELAKTDNKQRNASYNNDIYTEEEVADILGIKEDK